MNYLLDTHYLIWLLMEPSKIDKAQTTLLTDPDATKFVSKISLWEITLKYMLGKLELKGVSPEDLLVATRHSGLHIMDIDEKDIATSYHLPLIEGHKDPFDRLIIWQCIRNNLILMTADRKIQDYIPYGLKVC